MMMRRRPKPTRLALGLSALALLVALCVPVATAGLTCPELSASVGTSARDLPRSRGLDLELRILHVRIEFPWLKQLPITPAHHVVISWLADPQD